MSMNCGSDAMQKIDRIIAVIIVAGVFLLGFVAASCYYQDREDRLVDDAVAAGAATVVVKPSGKRVVTWVRAP